MTAIKFRRWGENYNQNLNEKLRARGVINSTFVYQLQQSYKNFEIFSYNKIKYYNGGGMIQIKLKTN